MYFLKMFLTIFDSSIEARHSVIVNCGVNSGVMGLFYKMPLLFTNQITQSVKKTFPRIPRLIKFYQNNNQIRSNSSFSQNSKFFLGYVSKNNALQVFFFKDDKKFVPFLEMISEKRLQAKRSILVQVQSSQSYKELHSYCSTIGTVKQMLHYTVGVEPMVIGVMLLKE